MVWIATRAQRDVMARIYDAGSGTWTPAHQLNVVAGDDCWSARAGIDAAGNALVVWGQETGFAQPDDVWGARYETDMGWGASWNLEALSGDAVSLAVAVHEDGRACVVWSLEQAVRSDIYARRFDPPASWHAVESLEVDEMMETFSPCLAFAPSGDLIVCWTQEGFAPDRDESIWANQHIVGSGWSGETRLHEGQGNVWGTHLVVDGEGVATLAWHWETPTEAGIRARRRLRAGVWEDVVDVGGAAGEGIDPYSLVIAANPTGRVLAAWAQGPGDLAEKDIFARAFVPGAGWGEASVLDDAGLGMQPIPSAALDHHGNALAAWVQGIYDVGGAYLHNDAWCDALGADGAWRPPVLLEQGGVGSPKRAYVFLDRLGRGVVVWHSSRDASGARDIYYRLYR